MKTRIIETIQAAIPSAQITSNEGPRAWVFVKTGEPGALETLQGLFAKVQVSVLDDTRFAIPVDSVSF